MKFQISANVKKDTWLIFCQDFRINQLKPTLVQFSQPICLIRFVVILMNVLMELIRVTNMLHVTIKMVDIDANVIARV